MKRLVLALLLLSFPCVANAQVLELKKGDHICIIGNTFADRMQHHGWLETLIHARFPQHELVFRNLGYSGDEVAGFTEKPDRNYRMRSMDFGTADQWLAGKAPVPQPDKLNRNASVTANRFQLANTSADVIFAFFGYNESFAGEAGLPKFKQDLENFIKHTLAQRYSGKGAPRVVLFGPSAHEYLRDPNLPDGAENNARLKMYSQAMADVARANQVPFVDLFGPSQALYARSEKPLTINGVHFNEYGDRLLAEAIDIGLFGEARANRDGALLEKLRVVVNDKNFLWFNRYRTTDGYSTYGDRAFLKFTNGQSNYEVVQRELEVLDWMTANRDKVVWAAAQGKEIKPDDSNLPPFIPVT